jgi:hypothetical protein
VGLGISRQRIAPLALALAAAFLSTARGAAASQSAGCAEPIALVDTSAPDAVVGSGTPASCTQAELAAALVGGGVVVFDCGSAPVTIPITSTLQILADTVIDGGHRVTLDGGDSTRILSVPSVFTYGTPTLTVQRLAFARGRSGAGGGGDTQRGGGAIWTLGGSVEVIDCTFTGNRAPATGQDVAGGAIYNVGVGRVTVVGSTFHDNRASNGGAIGVLHSDLVMANTTLAGNAATGSGGNPGSGGNGGAVYSDGNDQTVSLCGVTIEDNDANAYGGGLFRVSNNGVGPMLVDRSSVLGNRIPDQSPSMAGGMYLQGVQIEMTASTVAWNEARSSGGLFIGPNGTTLSMTNVTVAENVALSSLAGGMAISSGVTGSIRNGTLARNRAPGPVAFAAATTGGQDVWLRNTVVDGHVVGNGWNPISCLNAFREGAGNLQWPVARAGGGSDSPGSLCSASAAVAAASLGALADHGGPTLTIAPGPGSPALGRGRDCPATDQRGAPRDPEVCDAGALEAPEPGAAEAAGAAAVGLAALLRRRRRPARSALARGAGTRPAARRRDTSS